MINCDVCLNDISCETCSEEYIFKNGKCIPEIEKCYEYGTDDLCSKCEENYALKENDRTLCFSLNDLNNHYTKDEGISYFPCENEISECSRCYYDSDQIKVKCYLCSSNFVYLEEDNSCLLKESLYKKFYYLNETHINKCSNAIHNCDECENNKNCSKCKNNFYMINDDTNNCIEVSNFGINDYYLNEESAMY